MSLQQKIGQRQFFSSLANPVVMPAILAVVLLLIICSITLQKIQTSQELVIRTNLESSLNAYTELVHIWHKQNTSALKVLVESTQGKLLLNKIIQERGSNELTRKELYDWLAPVILIMGFDGFSVMNKDYRMLAATSEAYRGKVAEQPETIEVLNKALLNQISISRPMIARMPIDGPHGPQPIGSIMQIMCTYVHVENNQSGFLCLRFNTKTSFFPLFLSGRSGISGEVYAIDRVGRFLTPSRFTSTKYHSPFTQEVRVPLSNGTLGALTDIVNSLILRKTSFVKVGYPDYRGIMVAGAGRWFEEMDMGVIVEQDMDEVLAPFNVTQHVVIGLTTSAILLIIILAITSIINRNRLQEREGRFRSLLTHLPAPVYMCSIEGTVIVVNPAFCRLVKMHHDDLIGATLNELPLANWLKPLIANIHTFTDNFMVEDIVESLTNAAGKTYYFRSVRFPVIYEQGGPHSGLACVLVDVSDRVEARQRLEAMNQQLEYLVNERTSELILAKDTALEATKVKADFLANMSHEIRTPLNAIIGLAHISLTQNPSEKIRNYLEKMRASGEHLLNIINDILNFSRMEAGKLKLDQEQLSIERVLDKVVDLVYNNAEAKGLHITVEIDPSIPLLLFGDELRLGQILINLTANAVKFTEQGNIYIRVKKMHDFPDAVELLFEVEDTGIGINAEKIAELFQPFHQVDSSRARRFEGTGLGLSICKNLAELMGGSFGVKSELGKGSCFSLVVILAKPPAVTTPSTVTPSSQSGSVMQAAFAPINICILVVEDNLLNQEIISTLLQTMGVTVTCAGSGIEALKIFIEQTFDLILMDIQLPLMDGVTATKKIRQLDIGGHIPIIALTANVLHGDREYYLASGMDDYLAKPINPQELYETILRWIKKPVAVTGTKIATTKHTKKTQNIYQGLSDGGIDTQLALTYLMGNNALYCRLLKRFSIERENFGEQINQWLAEKDYANILNNVHSLRSLAASLGMQGLEIIAARVEQECRENIFVQASLAELNQELQRCIDLVSHWLIENHSHINSKS